jgi:hypothetical protein
MDADELGRTRIPALQALGTQADLLVENDPVACLVLLDGLGGCGTGFDAGGVVAVPADDRHIDHSPVLEHMNLATEGLTTPVWYTEQAYSQARQPVQFCLSANR